RAMGSRRLAAKVPNRIPKAIPMIVPNTRREVRLAWRLVKAPADLVDYVICHELAHLRHMNHSTAFWGEVERQCPDYRQRRARLYATDHLYRSF
ncbi:MAG TPA: M48 family metallopeptidase, partial [Usitatibacter sp.]|nr:M48 family metallopeptidase [Usitatibacter sp.]